MLIRADAGHQMGIGHIMRSLALAQAWQNAGGKCIYLSHKLPLKLKNWLIKEHCRVFNLNQKAGSEQDARDTVKWAHRVNASWMVIDSYQFGFSYQKWIKKSHLPLLMIDDNGHAKKYVADIVLNQNIHVQRSFYRNRHSRTKLLLGTDYVLLRREFVKAEKKKRRVIPKIAKNLLITLGGGDPTGTVARVVRAVRKIKAPKLKTRVLTGKMKEMPKLMSWADLAVSGGGTSCYEMAFMGLPNIMITIAENQKASALVLNAKKAAVLAGWWKKFEDKRFRKLLTQLVYDQSCRKKISSNQKRLVDGKGADRVVHLMRQMSL